MRAEGQAYDQMRLVTEDKHGHGTNERALASAATGGVWVQFSVNFIARFPHATVHARCSPCVFSSLACPVLPGGQQQAEAMYA